jgi:sugar phosphate isomerase/epimerase
MKKIKIISIVVLMAVSGIIVSALYSCKTTPHKNIGLQLYSIRDSIMKDVPAAIAKVAKMGYKFVEPAGYEAGKFYGMEPAAFKSLCQANGMSIVSSHTGQALPDSAHMAATMAWWDTCINAHALAGAKFIIQPFMGDEAYRSLDTLKMYCNYFNTIGEKCKAKGIRFGYHNHNMEFSTKLDGQTIYDFMLTNTDPEKVMYEMDLYWATKGGANPVDYFSKYPGRFELWHIKDETEIGNKDGIVDFAAIWASAPKSGMQYGIVEVERYNFDQFTSCKMSIDYLNTTSFVVMPK